MVTQQFKLRGGLTFNFNVPATLEEFTSCAKGDASVALKSAIDDVMLRSVHAWVRDELADAVMAANTDVPRTTKPHPNTDKAAKGETVWDEPAGEYINRVAATKGVEVTAFQPLLDKIIADNDAAPATNDDGTVNQSKVIFDPSQTERAPRAEKLTKFIEQAKQLLALEEKPRRRALKMISAVIDVDVSNLTDPVALAPHIKAWRNADITKITA